MILSLDSNVEVLYLFGREFLLTLRGDEKTPSQYFIWDSPDYEGGTNTIRPISHENAEMFFPYSRWKGNHEVGNYCGLNVKFLLDSEWLPPLPSQS